MIDAILKFVGTAAQTVPSPALLQLLHLLEKILHISPKMILAFPRMEQGVHNQYMDSVQFLEGLSPTCR
jgi:hypothetical protein